MQKQKVFKVHESDSQTKMGTWEHGSQSQRWKGLSFLTLKQLKHGNRQSVQDFCFWKTFTIVLIYKDKCENKHAFASIYSRPSVNTMSWVQTAIGGAEGSGAAGESIQTETPTSLE